ncbi:MAG: hypothetical protein PVJ57_02740 [Phycisphaerae bacterium]|jgi:hypothetical protein
MTECNTLSSAVATPVAPERRTEPRNAVAGSLWIVDHHGSTVLKCQCVESSHNGLRLRVPLGYGIAEGQRYELCSHLPGHQPPEGFGLIGRRWATVVRTQVRLGEDEDHLDVGVVLDTAVGHTLTRPASPVRV